VSLEHRVWLDCHATISTLLEKTIVTKCCGNAYIEFKALSAASSTTSEPAPAVEHLAELQRKITEPGSGFLPEDGKGWGPEYVCIQLITWNRSGKGKRLRRTASTVAIGHWIPPVTCFLVLQKRPGQDDVYTRIGIGYSAAVRDWDDSLGHKRREEPWLAEAEWEEPKWRFLLFEGSDEKLVTVV
jgi:hypothetical protein